MSSDQFKLLGFVLLPSLYEAQHTTLEFYTVYLIIRIIEIYTRLIYNKYFDISHSFTVNGLHAILVHATTLFALEFMVSRDYILPT